jgi:hypothetical protein
MAHNVEAASGPVSPGWLPTTGRNTLRDRLNKKKFDFLIQNLRRADISSLATARSANSVLSKRSP